MKCSDRKIGQIFVAITLVNALNTPFLMRNSNPQRFIFPNNGKNILKKVSLSVRINAVSPTAYNWQNLKYNLTMQSSNSGSQLLNLPQFRNVSGAPQFFQANERFSIQLDNYNPNFETVTEQIIIDSFEDMFFACMLDNTAIGTVTATAVITIEYIEIQNMFN